MTPRHVRRATTVALGAAALALTACDDRTAAPLGPDDLVADAAAEARDLPFYGNGSLRRASPGAACESARDAEFDFWIGNWDVFNVADALVGTNVVTEEAGGCAVRESWISSTGGAGFSLNAYDPETGQWYQTYLANWASAHLDMAGGPDATADMHLAGDRHFPGLTIQDDWTWTQEGPDQVRQVGNTTFQFAGGGGFTNTFVGVYRRNDELVRAEPNPPTRPCGPLPDIEFMLGDWNVSAVRGPELGTATLVRAAGTCAFEERFATPGGIEAISAFWWQRAPDGGPFHSVYVDSEGERVQLAGDVVGGRLVLEGEEPGHGGATSLRVVWEPAGDGMVQTWSVSTDGGATWKERLALEYTPAP